MNVLYIGVFKTGTFLQNSLPRIYVRPSSLGLGACSMGDQNHQHPSKRAFSGCIFPDSIRDTLKINVMGIFDTRLVKCDRQSP